MLIAGSCYPPLHAVSRLVCHRRATQVAAAMDKLSAVGRLFAEAAFLFGELRRQRLAEVSGLQHWADLELARPGHRIGAGEYANRWGGWLPIEVGFGLTESGRAGVEAAMA